MNGTAALLVLAGGIAGGTAQYVLWALAPVVDFVGPRLAGMRGYVVAAEHFVERHGLVVLIAIGESVVAGTS
jgi:low temperature requirement protein LtrA